MVVWRLRVLGWLFSLLFLAVQVRLVHLQFATREFWEKEALAARTDVRTVPAPRGDIVDRLGRPLAVSRPQHSLVLVYSSFRQNTVVGQVAAASRILARLPRSTTPVPGVRDVVARPREWLRHVLERSDADFEGAPAAARADYGFYVRRLLGFSESQFRSRRGAQAARGAPYWTLKGADRDAVLAPLAAAVARQEDALRDLAEACGEDVNAFFERLDQEIVKLDADVARALGRHGAVPPFSRQERVVRRDLEYRARELARMVPYRAVFLVSLRSDVYGGLEVRDEERRHYPEEFENVSPVLIGSVRSPFQALLERTDEHRLQLLELTSRLPEEMDEETSVAIDRLKTRIREEDYLPQEEQGGSGLEGLLEPVLRGRRGWRHVETDSGGDDALLHQMRPPDRGHTVRLTLDAPLQVAAERVLAQHGKNGAIVLLSPADGAIRALATWPNPTRKELRERYEELANDARRPLHHRAYNPPGNPPAPGSVFKILTTIAGLEERTINPFTTFDCQRAITLRTVKLHCEGLHGPIALDTAFAKSCNVYYYRLGERLGLDAMARWAERLGLGRPSGFGDPQYLGLSGPGGAPGAATPPWNSGAGSPSLSVGEIAAAIHMHERDSVTLAMRSAIGQGRFDDVTPLQIAAMCAPVANGGRAVRPYLVDWLGDVRARRDPPKPLGLAPSTLAEMKKIMLAVCEPGGTAGPIAGRDLRPYGVAAKTGTSQSWGNRDGDPNTLEAMPTHAWFAGYLPDRAPKLCFAVYLEHAGAHGGDVAAPLFNRLLEQPEMQQFLAEGEP